MHAVPPADAELDVWLSQAGLRRTRATRAVLRLFVADGSWAATHADVEVALTAQGLAVNRVTLYRLLDRLAATGLLSRHADDAARTWRYALAPEVANGDGSVVPRFECDACHRQFRLTEASPPTQAVADQLLKTLASLGHQGQRVDLSIHGTCNVCVDPVDAGSPQGNAGSGTSGVPA
jgi:Fur family ferric uptake transcriptional regulator